MSGVGLTDLAHGEIDEVHASTTDFDSHREESHLGQLFIGLEKSVQSPTIIRDVVCISLQALEEETRVG